ncbi:MAG: ATP-dependent zinc protease [Spongiibacter sp.]|uniref:Retropepsin-like aspartic endopeptidase domain-containing protein n=1 Tax=Spongiibacter thalassae TaxID=2721624 RepID=A0ABX1GHG2_9GAMM|nr:hypothetical protein [Spongiibacter thalassae]
MRHLSPYLSALSTAFILLMLAAPAALAEQQRTFGLTEYVYIEELGVKYKAKIDTGAESASINAINAKVEKAKGDDEDDIVHFDLVLPSGELKSVSLPLEKHIRIIRRAGDMDEDDKYYHRRPVLKLTLCVGGRSEKVEVNLADRRQFSKPMLFGSDPLIAFNAIVDPSQSFLQNKTACEKAEETTSDDTVANNEESAG